MSISCSCGDSDYEWFYEAEKDYSELKASKRKRCESCNTLIDIGSTVLKSHKYRPPRSDIEESIYGDEVPMAPFYFCENCADLYFSIIDYGYCVTLNGDSMKEMALQVAETEYIKAQEQQK